MNDKGAQNNMVYEEFNHLDSKRSIERFQKYDACYARYLMGKFERSVTVDTDMTEENQSEEIIRTSRSPLLKDSCYKPIVGVVVEDESSTGKKKRKRDAYNV
ncbi:uncharacterized protein LOC131604493 [Vicia villosa]|uniref:uncharacterized protein LOC131604493 n=1 Tax=Vicia villosa TaxID=3911 RepID=UPI00273C3A9E|nr:uncharacterized protein LOC131604493 [Vicia villosa]